MTDTSDDLARLLRLDDETALPGQPDGIQAAYAFSAEEWRQSAIAAAEALASTGEPFTVADLSSHGVTEPDIPQRYGAVFAAISSRGIARCIGWTAHRTAGGSENGIRVWLGTTDHKDGEQPWQK